MSAKDKKSEVFS